MRKRTGMISDAHASYIQIFLNISLPGLTRVILLRQHQPLHMAAFRTGFSFSLYLCLPCKLPLSINPLNLPENHVGFFSHLARCILRKRGFTKNCHHAVRFIWVLPLEKYREGVLNRCTRTTEVLKTRLKLVIRVGIVVDSGSAPVLDMLDKML